MRTDNRTKYIMNEFKEFCRENGIFKQYATFVTPQQNGVTKRMNCIFLNRARIIIFESSLFPGEGHAPAGFFRVENYSFSCLRRGFFFLPWPPVAPRRHLLPLRW